MVPVLLWEARVSLRALQLQQLVGLLCGLGQGALHNIETGISVLVWGYHIPTRHYHCGCYENSSTAAMASRDAISPHQPT
jgi:hypothetical protein